METHYFTINVRRPKPKVTVHSALIAASVLVGVLIGLCIRSISPAEAKEQNYVNQKAHLSIQFMEVSVPPELTHTSSPLEIEPDQEYPPLSQEDTYRLAKALWGEYRSASKEQQAGVIWCVFNRVDSPQFPDTIAEVCTHEQFHGYSFNNPVEQELIDMVLDVYDRWQREKLGEQDVGRVLPPEYVFFHGDGKVNHYRTQFIHNGDYWDWSLPSPY